MEDIEVGVRALQAADTLAAAGLFRQSPEAAQWSAESLAESIAAGMCGWVADSGGQIAGVLIGRGIADEFEIMNVAVVPTHRRKGIGRALVAAALDFARASGCIAVLLEVRASNGSAIALYLGCGFTETGRRKQYYQNPTDDALLLTLQLHKNNSNL